MSAVMMAPQIVDLKASTFDQVVVAMTQGDGDSPQVREIGGACVRVWLKVAVTTAASGEQTLMVRCDAMTVYRRVA